MSDKCESDIFKKGHAICTLDACMYRAEKWVQAVARESGQRVDWHYSGGRANVLYVGDHAKVLEAMIKLTPDLEADLARQPRECWSCQEKTHRAGRILLVYGVGEHGLYRKGDPL